ncbi:MAG: TonB-dependent receptor [Bacteroidetes bacterium]|nr:TonB-dependent receptor [Bacteroidota bacterium]MCL2302162.1 TonB-dependent receptor [Lentimicrobiaceae bacterium]
MSLKKSAKIRVICVICVLFWHSPYAQLDTTKVYEINEITITFTQQREIIPAQRLSGEELHRLSSHSVADAIRYFSGIQIKDFGGIGGLKTVDIRSMGTNHVGVFYDGIQLGNAQNGQIDLGKFSLDNIEEIALYNGQKSEIFQPAKDFGSAGAIYLQTRRPTFEEAQKFNIRALFRTGSFGLANPSILWEQKITKSLSSSFNAEYIYATGKYKFRYRRVLPDGMVAYDTTAVRQNGDIQAVRLEGGLFGHTQKINWNAKVYFYNSERGIPGAIINNVWKHSQRQWDRNFFTQASLTTPIHRRYELLARFKYANDYMRYLNSDTTLMYIDNNFTQQEIYTCFANKVKVFKSWDISLATDFQWNMLQANLRNFAQPQRYTTLVALATAFDIWRIKTQASILSTFIHDKVAKPTSSHSNNHEFTPAVIFSCKPLKKEEFYINAFYKRAFRMPTFNDLYYTDIGNAALQPEYVTQYNLGLQYAKSLKKGILENLTLKTDAYYNEVTNKIIAIPKGSGQFRWMMMNIGFVKIRGIDAMAQLNWKFPYDIRLQTHINYTYQKAQDFSDPTDNDAVAGTYRGQIAYIPWHNGSFTLQFSYKTYNLNYCFIYVGERYHNSANIRANHEQPWYTHDLSLGKTFCFKKWNFKVSAEINNIFNQQYEVVLNYPMPGTNFRVILKFEI